MHPVLELIRNIAPAQFADGDDAAVVAALNDLSIQRTDVTLRTARWVMITFAPEEAGLILATLQNHTAFGPLSPFVKAGYDSLVSDGLDLSNPTTQQLITQVGGAAGWGDDLTNRIKNHGVWFVSPSSQALGRDATLEDVAEARTYANSVLKQKELSDRLASTYNTLQSEINEGIITSFVQLNDRAIALLNA